jgi:ATP-dependent Clp endopeptidase proteolytic subunit ClpP
MKDFPIYPQTSSLRLPYCEYLDSAEPEMYLTDDIGKNPDGSGIDCELFSRTLMTLDQIAQEKGYKRICIYINSGGGEVETGMSIYDAILNVTIPVDTYVTGRAASMAGVIFQAGRKRFMAEYAQLMLHNPSGTSNEKQIEAAKKSLVKMLSRHGISEKKISTLMDDESWILADKCKPLGLCDEVIDISKLNNKTPEHKVLWNQFETVTNSLAKTKTMKNIALALGLSETATENEIKEKAALLNMDVKDGKLVAKDKKKKEDEEEDDEEGEGEDKGGKSKNAEYPSKKEHDALCKMVEKHGKRLDKMEEKMKNQAEAEMTNKVENKINALIASGKLKNEEALVTKARASLTAAFDVAAEVYDMLPGTVNAGGNGNVIKLGSTRINQLIETASAENKENKEKTDLAVKVEPATSLSAETLTDHVNHGDYVTPVSPAATVKRPNIRDAKAEISKGK